jgi:hypothetical protein
MRMIADGMIGRKPLVRRSTSANGPSRHVVLRRVSVAFGAKRTLVLCNWFRRRLAAPMDALRRQPAVARANAAQGSFRTVTRLYGGLTSKGKVWYPCFPPESGCASTVRTSKHR